MSFYKKRKTAPTNAELYNRNIPPWDVKKNLL